jgi:hypothetical protein
MGMVFEPVKSWSIILKYTLAGNEYQGDLSHHTTLRQFFHRFPKQAALVGYVVKKNRIDTEHERMITAAALSFEYRDKHVLACNDFRDVFALAGFFENPEHSALAKCVEYVKKGKINN